MIRSTAARPRYTAWLNPFRVVLLGTVVVAFLLTLPITIGPGDHEQNTSCGNALRMDLNPWRTAEYAPDRQFYYERAYRSCMAARVDRVAQAVGVLSVTVLIAAFLARRGTLPQPGRPVGGGA